MARRLVGRYLRLLRHVLLRARGRRIRRCRRRSFVAVRVSRQIYASLQRLRESLQRMRAVLPSYPAHRAFRRPFAAELRLCARVSPIGEWRLECRFRNRLSNRETPRAECARRAYLGFVENARCAVAYRVATNQPSCFEAPFTSVSMRFDTMKSFCRCTSKGLP